MTGERGNGQRGTREDEVLLRDAQEGDLAVFFEHQRDAVACRMAAFTSRGQEEFLAHWKKKVLGDAGVIKQTVVVQGEVAGHMVCFEQAGRRLVGYWIGREFWGKAVATRALTAFLAQVTDRPLHAYVAKGNVGSTRVLEKCGFVRSGEDRVDSEEEPNAVEEWVFVQTA